MLPVTLGDPHTTPVYAFFIAFHIFLVGECRDFRFVMQVDHSYSQPAYDKLSLKGACL